MIDYQKPVHKRVKNTSTSNKKPLLRAVTDCNTSELKLAVAVSKNFISHNILLVFLSNYNRVAPASLLTAD